MPGALPFEYPGFVDASEGSRLGACLPLFRVVLGRVVFGRFNLMVGTVTLGAGPVFLGPAILPVHGPH